MKKVLFCLWLLTHSLWVLPQPIGSFRFVALGDMPYQLPEDIGRFERLIAAINHKNPAFTIFVGDTKSGSSECSNLYNQKIKSYFNQFSSPLIYSIGDNEWTDCHRPLAGSYDPIERLATLRETFFDSNKSLGKKQLNLVRQADADPKHRKFVENSYWVINNFLFVNLHIPGSNNNFERDDRSKAEYRERNQANLEWMRSAFALATKNSYKGIVFAFQADMFYSPKQFIDEESGYRDTLRTLSEYAEKFKKPVLLIHGDSHKLIIDQPLKTIDQKNILENVLRLQVMGAEQVQAVEVQVNPQADQPFTFTPLLLPENRIRPIQ